MVGITLSPDQIRQAPPEVRRWIAGALGLYQPTPALQPPKHHLTSCTLEEARAVLSLIQGFLPVVGVFFELGREPVAVSPQGLRAIRLDDMARHAKLREPEQIMACLVAIDEALQRVRGEPTAVLTALDGAGHCLVTDATAKSILALWHEIVAAHDLGRPAAAAAVDTQQAPAFQAPYGMPVTFTDAQPAASAAG